MNFEKLFKYGVTPKEGVFAGKRFIVDRINKAVVSCHNADDEHHKEEFTHGSYDIWQEPKTLFEDGSIAPTWGNLKRAMEAAGLPDDTIFVVPSTDWSLLGYGEPASFTVEMLRQPYEKPKKHIVVK